jgi:hypothetical protein
MWCQCPELLSELRGGDEAVVYSVNTGRIGRGVVGQLVVLHG